MGVFDWFLGEKEDEEYDEDASSGEGADDDDDESEEDAAIVSALEGANSIGERDWFAAEQHAGYVAIAEAAFEAKQAKARRRAEAEAERRRESVRRANHEQKRVWEAEQVAKRKRERDQWEAEQRAEASAKARAKEAAANPADDGRARTATASVSLNRVQTARVERQADPAERAAATRLANAQAAKIEAEAELLRAKAKAALQPAITRPVRVGRDGGLSPSGRDGASVPKATSVVDRDVSGSVRLAKGTRARAVPEEIEGYNEADRMALVSVGHWPPTPAERRGGFWTPDTDWPSGWTLTGGDLARLRGETSLTRAVFASQLGVPSAAVKDAEVRPREKVGPALQIALRRALDYEIEQRRLRREARMAASAPMADPPLQRMSEIPAVMAVDSVEPSGPSPNAEPMRTYTGADLVRLRAERGLSQREMADVLGVEQGTVSKGEGKADAALGPALQDALTRIAPAAGVGSGPVIPE